VAVEVALEVEVVNLLTFRGLEELLEGGIRVDVVLVLEVLFLDVGVDGLGNLRAAHLSASGLAEEAAELIRDGNGALKDGRGTLDLIAILINLRTALTLASILDFAVDTLFKLLDLGDHGRGSLTEGVEVGEESLEVIIKSGGRTRGGSGLSGRGRGRSNNNRGNYRGRRRSSDRGRGRRRGLLGNLLGLRGNGGRGRGSDGLRGSSSLRGLLSNLGGGGGIHHTRSRGILGRHFTHYPILCRIGRQFFEICAFKFGQLLCLPFFF
jgi:hypothetical protein